MLNRALAASLALLLAAPSPLMAQKANRAQDYKNLEQILEQDFTPEQTRSLAPAAPATTAPAGEAGAAAPKQSYEWVKPEKGDAKTINRLQKKSQQVLEPKKKVLQKRSDAATSDPSWWGTIFSYFSKPKPEPMKSEERSLAPSGTIEAGATSSPSTPNADDPGLSRSLAPAPTPDELVVAQAEVPIAKKNSYVIQLKPETSKDQLADLLQKYDLTITNRFPRLGVITVEVNEVATRSLSGAPEPEEAPASAKEKLQKVLEPQIIKDLRGEGVVNSAFVNSTMDTKALPKPSALRVEADGKVYSWRWTSGDDTDGNWGLKAMRLPPVWSILERHRKLNPDTPRPKIAVVDGGFIDHKGLKFSSLQGPKGAVVEEADCGTNHGMHVAGIIAARQGDAPGTDGIVPEARLDAIAVSGSITGDAGGLGVEEAWQLQTKLFDDVLFKTMSYVFQNEGKPDNLRVINISLGYNFLALDLLSDQELSSIGEVKRHIGSQAVLIRDLAKSFESEILFVVAAGNDSDGREKPLDARWASPFAWAAKHEWVSGEPVHNILVVEAADRAGKRASFSNTGGDVAAPGVDILSTLASGKRAYGVCSGTSQASPHAAALAAILFELDPAKTPADIISLMKASGRARDGETPEIDALDAVLNLSPSLVRYLADLDTDGAVGSTDMAIFSRHMSALDAAATSSAEFKEDLNGDGLVDDNECFWPKIDFNGSGQAAGSLAVKDTRSVRGARLGDMQTLALAWSDTRKTYDVALSESGYKPGANDGSMFTALTGGTLSCRRITEIAAAEPATGTTTGSTTTGAATTLATSEPGEATRGLDVADSTPKSDDLTEVRKEAKTGIDQLKRENPDMEITVDPSTGLPTSIRGLVPKAAAAAPLGAAKPATGEMTEADVKRAVDSFFATSALRSAFATKNKDAKRVVTGTQRDPDFPDRYVAEVEQRVGDVPVFGSATKLTVERSLGVTKITGKSSPVAIADMTPTVTSADALDKGKAKVNELLSKSPDAARTFPRAGGADGETLAPQLIVFDPSVVAKRLKGPTRLAWLIVFESFHVFVDAKTGEVFHYYRDQPSGMIRRIYDLEQGSVFPGKKIFDEETRERSSAIDEDALSAFLNAGLVRDYFYLYFGRDSFDDNRGTLEAYVRAGKSAEAYWCTGKSFDCPKPSVMIYGPGMAAAIDIIGHEMTHGIIAHSKKINYFEEAGAVNESFADIFGTLIEFHARGTAGNWLIGEAAPGFTATSPLRSMADPRLAREDGKSGFDRTAPFSLGNRGQPDHYAELLTPADKLCDSTAYDDNGCVHFNSGILNKFAFLLAEGGEHGGVSVTGIGRQKLARLAYRTMTINISKSSGLVEAAHGFEVSCSELAEGKLGGLVPADCEQVSAARRAVGLETPSS